MDVVPANGAIAAAECVPSRTVMPSTTTGEPGENVPVEAPIVRPAASASHAEAVVVNWKTTSWVVVATADTVPSETCPVVRPPEQPPRMQKGSDCVADERAANPAGHHLEGSKRVYLIAER